MWDQVVVSSNALHSPRRIAQVHQCWPKTKWERHTPRTYGQVVAGSGSRRGTKANWPRDRFSESRQGTLGPPYRMRYRRKREVYPQDKLGSYSSIAQSSDTTAYTIGMEDAC